MVWLFDLSFGLVTVSQGLLNPTASKQLSLYPFKCNVMHNIDIILKPVLCEKIPPSILGCCDLSQRCILSIEIAPTITWLYWRRIERDHMETQETKLVDGQSGDFCSINLTQRGQNTAYNNTINFSLSSLFSVNIFFYINFFCGCYNYLVMIF